MKKESFMERDMQSVYLIVPIEILAFSEHKTTGHKMQVILGIQPNIIHKTLIPDTM